jgi:predicted GNAT family acetyltransferase
MNEAEGAATVRHNPGASRFEVGNADEMAVAEYARHDDTLVLTRTFVPPALRGRGLAEKLVRAALALAREEKRRVVPACSYVATFITRHPEFQELTR